MTIDTWKKIVALGALTGMRSMAGLATLARTHRRARSVMAFAAVGEMIADKTPWIADRIDPLPLGGRAIMGAAVGAFVANDQRQHVVLGAMIGAATAVAAAHLAYRVRKRLPLPGIAAGLLEDGLVLAIGSRYA